VTLMLHLHQQLSWCTSEMLKGTVPPNPSVTYDSFLSNSRCRAFAMSTTDQTFSLVRVLQSATISQIATTVVLIVSAISPQIA